MRGGWGKGSGRPRGNACAASPSARPNASPRCRGTGRRRNLHLLRNRAVVRHHARAGTPRGQRDGGRWVAGGVRGVRGDGAGAVGGMWRLRRGSRRDDHASISTHPRDISSTNTLVRESEPQTSSCQTVRDLVPWRPQRSVSLECKRSPACPAEMVDIVDSLTRSRMMSGIRGQNTRPEIMVRRALHARGFRFGLNRQLLPGRPDAVLPRWKVAIFVHGCFWHWHGCHLSKMPVSNRAFWNAKLTGNQDRDSRAQIALISMGWRVAMIWECSLRGRAARAGFDEMMDELARWIRDQPTIVAFETTFDLGHA